MLGLQARSGLCELSLLSQSPPHSRLDSGQGCWKRVDKGHRPSWNKDVTDKYAAQLKEDVEWRKDVTEKTGLGFALPVSVETSIGQLGQPEIVKSEEAKAP